MEAPKKKNSLPIGYIIALIVPIIVIVLVVVLWPSGEGNSTPTPTVNPTASTTSSASVTPTATHHPVGEVTVSIDCPETVKITGGSRYFHVFVNITDVTDFDAAQYDISYDPKVIKVQDVLAGEIGDTLIPIEEWGYVPANTQGTLRIVNSVPKSPGVSGEGYLADIYFRVFGDPGESTDISFVEGFGEPEGYLMIGDNTGFEITSDWTDGSVTIE